MSIQKPQNLFSTLATAALLAACQPMPLNPPTNSSSSQGESHQAQEQPVSMPDELPQSPLPPELTPTLDKEAFTIQNVQGTLSFTQRTLRNYLYGEAKGILAYNFKDWQQVKVQIHKSDKNERVFLALFKWSHTTNAWRFERWVEELAFIYRKDWDFDAIYLGYAVSQNPVDISVSLDTSVQATAETAAPEPVLSSQHYRNTFDQGGANHYECTRYAYGRSSEVNGRVPQFNRNSNRHAGFWADLVTNMSKTNTPKKGAIAVFSGGQHGHVAFVEEVKANGNIVISEANLRGRGQYNGRTELTPEQIKVRGTQRLVSYLVF